jgi:hypothetical protein
VGVSCASSVAHRYFELRDLAAARAAPDLFALDEWTDELLDLF